MNVYVEDVLGWHKKVFLNEQPIRCLYADEERGFVVVPLSTTTENALIEKRYYDEEGNQLCILKRGVVRIEEPVKEESLCQA